MFHSSKPARQSAFTLVEVLVAMGIFAVLATGYLIVSGDTIRGLGRLQSKTFALWIAQDTITRIRTYDNGKANPFSQQEVTFADEKWQIKFETENTDVQSMKRVTILVSHEAEPDQSLASVEAYFIDGQFVPQEL